MILIPFALRHIPKWNALEIKQNGRNTSATYGKFMTYLDSVPQTVQIDNFTWMIPDREIDAWMEQFGWITTMTQTLASIKGNEQPIMPNITYTPKHLDQLKLSPYPFQRIGIAYLVTVEAGIIGDEMGLGR